MRNSEYETLDEEVLSLEKQIQEQSQEEVPEDVVEEKSEEEILSESEEEVKEEEVKPEPTDEEDKSQEEQDKEEEALILGKFKSDEAVRKAYKDLESKLGEITSERKRLEAERDEAYRKNQEWQEWSKSQKSEETYIDDDLDDPILNELQTVKKQIKYISDKDAATETYNKAINEMAVMYNKCASDKENFPYFVELKDEMTQLAKDIQGQFPELAFNPNAIPQLYRMAEAQKIKADSTTSISKLSTIESENEKLKNELNKLRKLSPEEEDAAFVEGGSSSDGDIDFEALPLEEQVKALEAKIGRARK